MTIAEAYQKLQNSKLFKDSFWAVFGNGMGNALMLLAGILIARLLGKDLYGEYGIVKSSMNYLAPFATFGLGFTSTKYIAQYVEKHRQYVRQIVYDALSITFVLSCFVAVALVAFAQQLADYVDVPTLKPAFQALAAIIVFKAMTTTLTGILSGYKAFKSIAYNSVSSGLFLLICCVPLTFYYGLEGSLISLMLSQAFNATINYLSIYKVTKQQPNQQQKCFKKEMLSFTFPIALQETSFTICHWAAIMFLTKYASAGELGLYSAGAQWGAVILMVPVLMNNVVLSYLSGNVSDKTRHQHTMKTMLLVNFISTLLPFIVVYVLAGFIAKFYGPTFSELPAILRIIILSTIFDCFSAVFKSEFMAQGRTWTLFIVRCIRDVALVSLVYVVMTQTNGANGALNYAWIGVATSALFLALIYTAYRLPKHTYKSIETL